MKSIRWIKKAMEASNEFENRVYNDAMENAADLQRFFADDAMIDGYRFHDHYSSFFLTVSDRDQVIESMAASDFYGCREDVKKAHAALHRFNAMEYSNKNFEQLDEWLDAAARDLLQIYENDLHYYEDYKNALEMFFDDYTANEWDFYDNYRISGGHVVLKHPACRAYDEILK